MSFCEENGESIAMVQERNMEALRKILSLYDKKEMTTIVIGTHGTALSSILNRYDQSFGYDNFIRIMDWTPYIISLTFENDEVIKKEEHLHIANESRKKKSH